MRRRANLARRTGACMTILRPQAASSPQTSCGRNTLAYFLALFCPEYRTLFFILLALCAAAALTAYTQNELLGMLVKSFSTASETPALARTGDAASEGRVLVAAWLQDQAGRLGMSLPAVLLALLVVARVLFSMISYIKLCTDGRLNIRAKSDLETEILIHLLHKDDQFFNRHSSAETINRLVVDLQRVNQRRSDLVEAWWCGLLLASNLLFFLLKDWRLALVALAGCLSGVFWSRGVSRRIRSLDERFLHYEDQVKSAIEDFLAAAVEVQTGNRYGAVRQALLKMHEGRALAFLGFIKQNTRLSSIYSLSSILTFMTMVLVLLYMRHGGGFTEAVALMPVVVMTLPMLFENARQLVLIRLKFQIAGTSIKRLLEYESTIRPEAGPVDLARGSVLELRDVSFGHTDAGAGTRAGLSHVHAVFRPGTWTAMLSRTHADKNTLFKLLLGRLEPESGQVTYDGRSLFSLPGDVVASLIAFMPGQGTPINASIFRNIVFAQTAPGFLAGPDELSADGLALIEAVGLGAICRLKALDIKPDIEAPATGAPGVIVELRQRVRTALHARHGIDIVPYTKNATSQTQCILERLLGGKCDQQRTLAILQRDAGRALRGMSDQDVQRRLHAVGTAFLQEYSRLLAIPEYDDFALLAPFPVEFGLWRLRAACAHLATQAPLTPKEQTLLTLAGLTVTGAELPPGEAAAVYETCSCDAFPKEARRLRRLLKGCWQPFDPALVHPYLTWRENLIFGDMTLLSSRKARLVDATILDVIDESGCQAMFTRLGLGYPAGRKGANLDPGQAQLMAICRTAIANAPVMLLDEPSSALDPVARDQLAAFLTRWKEGRIVVTVTRDHELAACADELLTLEGGRLGKGNLQNEGPGPLPSAELTS